MNPIEKVALIEKITVSRETGCLDLEGYDFSADNFTYLLNFLHSNPSLKQIRISKSCLNLVQVEEILKIANRNLMKGVKVFDDRGSSFGSVYTDWSRYNKEKQTAFKLNETTSIALNKFKGKLPDCIIDFGAGTGQETLPLLKFGCPYVIAIESDHEAAKTLKKRGIDYLQNAMLDVYELAFLKFKPTRMCDFFIASFTWPHRPQEDFEACWKHTLNCVRKGGWIAGHFFGPREKKDPGLSYHTLEDLITLLEPDFDEVQIREETVESRRLVYGGGEPLWGVLYHVVARRKSGENPTLNHYSLLAPTDKGG